MPESPSQPYSRLAPVDALRGAVMILMAIDHTRDFFHSAAFQGSPENLATTTVLTFLTRWITHFCAPVFVFTAGIGAFYWLQKPGRTPAELSRYLVTRGLWLIVLDATVVRLAFFFNVLEGPIIFTTLWALGWSMIALAALARLPIRITAIFSIAVILLHNCADGIQANRFGPAWGWLWNFLHQPGGLPIAGILVIFGYPFIPWFAVMAAGFCFAPYAKQPRVCFRLGLTMTAAFLLLRFVNVYGDPSPWDPASPVSILSFLRVTKYPPSLDFLLMTLGPALMALAAFHRFDWKASNPLIVFGRTPMFYFLAHLFLIHSYAVAAALVRYGTAGFLFHPIPTMGGNPPGFPSDYGYSLAGTYLAWLAVVVTMYPLCRWFAGLKARRPDNLLLRYL